MARTYAQARKLLLQSLKLEGWEVVDSLKTPHATLGTFRLWFAAQGIHYSVSSVGFSDVGRHSLHVDIRKPSTDDLVKYVTSIGLSRT